MTFCARRAEGYPPCVEQCRECREELAQVTRSPAGILTCRKCKSVGTIVDLQACCRVQRMRDADLAASSTT